MTKLDSIFKSRDITLPKKVHLVKAMIFPVVMDGCEGWNIKKAECSRIDAFELWCCRRFLRVPWTARRSKESILKKSVLNIHWKYWCWSWNFNTLAAWCKEPTHWKKTLMLEKLKAVWGECDRAWEGWVASATHWTWFWASSMSWWRTGWPAVLQSMRFQRVRYNWATELIQPKWYSDQFWLEENSVVEVFAWYPPSQIHHWYPFEVSDYWHWSCVDMYLWPSKQCEEPDALFKVLPTGISLPLHFPSGPYLKIMGVYFQLLPV